MISDTDGGLHPKILEIFSTMDFIIHCGAIGAPEVLLDLSNCSPISGVLGPNDHAEEFQPLGLELCKTFLEVPLFVRHDLGTPSKPTKDLPRILETVAPKVLLFGKTREVFNGTVDDRLWFNPGSGSPSSNGRACSIGILEIEGQSVRGEIIPLPNTLS
ncbi:MAG: metallophosphoesterase family protein [Planctomycetota bacterium]